MRHRDSSLWFLLCLAAWCDFAPSAAAQAADSLPTLTTAQQVRELSNAEAGRGQPVRLRGIVTYHDPKWETLFVQDATAGIYIGAGDHSRPHYRAGQLVEVDGVTAAGTFAPIVAERRIAVVGAAPLPSPKAMTFEQLATGKDDSQWIEMTGLVRGMSIEWQRLMIDISHGGARFLAHFPAPPSLRLPTNLMHCEVRLRGVAGSVLNQKNQLIGMRMFVPDLEQVTVIAPAPADPFNLPLLPLSSLLGFNPHYSSNRRIRVAGTVTLAWPSGTIYVQDDTDGLHVKLTAMKPRDDTSGQYLEPPPRVQLRPGDKIEATGYPAMGEFAPMLQDAEVRKISSGRALTPLRLTPEQALGGTNDAQAVELDARLLEISPRVSSGPEERALVLNSGEHIFQAHLEIPPNREVALRPQSMVRVKGVCSVALGPRHKPRSFRLLVHDLADISILRTPPWWTSANVPKLLAISGGIIVAGLGWLTVLRRQVRTQEERIRALNREAELQQERRRAEAALRESQQLLSSITQNISEGIYRSTPERGLVYVNEAFVRMFGYDSVDEMLKVPSARLYANAADRAKLIQLIENDGRFVNQEVELVRKDGSRFWGLLSSIGIYGDVSKKPIYFDGAISDITRRKRMEEELQSLNRDLERRIEERTAELRTSEARYRVMLENAPEAITVIDAATGRFLDPNHNTLRLFEMERDHLLALGPVELSPPAQADGRPSHEAYAKQLKAALDGDTPVFEWNHLHSDGTQFACEVRLARLPDATRQLVRASITDISERKRAEMELLKSLALEKELNQLKSSFVSMVSHEFRTPLGIIMSSAEILQRYLMKLTLEQRQEQLQAIHKSVRRMSSLMEEVLLLSRVEAGHMEYKPKAIDLDAFCRRLTEEVLSAMSRQCPIEFQPRDLPPEAMGDEGLLRHILTNLLSNAVKYSPPGEPVRFTAERRNGHAVFQVEDHGIGIPAADRDRLFKSFHRGQNTGHLPGTGLGLTIVKRCVDLHGGKIHVDSSEGRGTRFTVLLPLFEGGGDAKTV
ncbi:MAG: PAS domain S-box protein [Verrucomicrobia subdivision 3 bacterium]|nr:PAS domain S-box protein [Limisphaerales bacterium]